MTVGPPLIDDAAIREARASARRGARALPSALLGTFAVGAGVALVMLFTLLDYTFDQDPHRLVKILLGVAVVAGILARPRFGLLLLPVATPFLSWLPVIPVKAVNPLNVLVMSVFISYALQRVMRREPVFRGGDLGLPILALMVLAGLSILRGVAIPTGYDYDGGAAGLWLFRSSMTFSVYFVTLAMARGERDRRQLAWAIVIGFLLESYVTITGGRTGRGGRAEGSFGQPNELGAYLAMFTAFATALVPAVRRTAWKVVLVGVVVLGVSATLFTVSRGAVVAIALAMLYVGLRSSKPLAVVLVLALLTSPLWMPDYVTQRFTETEVQVEGTDESQLEGSAQARIDTWKALWKVVLEHPFDGVGFTGLASTLPETGEALGLEVKDTAHNTFLRMLAEMGIFGLLVFVWLLARAWRLGWRAARLGGSALDRGLGVGVGGATIAMAVSCAFGDRFFSILISGNFFIACALLDDLLRERREGAA